MTTHNVTNLPKRPLKERLKEHTDKLGWVAAGVCALSYAYLLGRTRGITLEADLFLISKDDNDEFQTQNVKDL